MDYHDAKNQKNLMHFELLKWLKTSFWPLFGPKWPILGPANFFQHFSHHQVLDLLILDHNTQNRRKLMHFEQDNDLKPHFGPFLALNGPFLGQQIFFSKIRKRHFSRLISD